ncbi:MAG: ADP-dependent glucokinase/phosphofructokinase [Lachnospiraceae bacterium]|nr:ADP-dependent glucokinase/phosphofructokinase [Lachnospiraceae bacterium]MDD7076749.1 ADP-dependent glucokinase/phosphofructokinase [Lachnospiraceae bacterium]MDY3729130.1 ADP-dependent glucokinase/phosphofructokinase [Candidatus Choladocola sp.]
MNIEEKFQKAYDSLEKHIESRNKKEQLTAMGYTSNLDLLCDFQVDKLNELLAEYMSGEDLTKMKPAKMIRTMQELLETVVYYCINGIGGEADVEDPELVKSSFSFKNGMGGTAVQAAMALAQIGGKTLVHLTDDSKEVCELLHSSYIHVVLGNGELGFTDQVISHNPQETHFIVQFKKGDQVRLGEQVIAIPCSNRLILTKNTVNEYLPLWEPYFKWIEQNAKQVTSNVLSSFNSILEKEVLKDRLQYVKNHVEIYRRNNPDGIVYFEDAHYHNEEVRRLCVETLYPCVDILSMNEEELQYTLKEMYGYDVDIDDIYSCIDGVEFLLDKFHIKKGVIVHTKDYAMFVGDSENIDIENGLMYGMIMATAKASHGNYGTKEQIRQVLELGVSEKGLSNLKKVEERGYGSRVILVPTKYIDKPKYTIGLGDSFTGGVQMCF